MSTLEPVKLCFLVRDILDLAVVDMVLAPFDHQWSRLRQTWRSKGARGVFSAVWVRFWMRYAGLSPFGRAATWLASLFVPPYYGRYYLACVSRKGYISPTATIHHADLYLGPNVFLDDRVLIFQHKHYGHLGGPVQLAEGVHVHRDTIIQTGAGGSVRIGARTYIQPRCQFSGYKAPIQIGSDVQIAPGCAFYPYNHSFAPGQFINKQPLETKGGIVIDDDAWLGVGVIVLDGVRIGKGAVIGAGSVVTEDIPDGAIAFGVPARVVKMRSDLGSNIPKENHGEV